MPRVESRRRGTRGLAWAATAGEARWRRRCPAPDEPLDAPRMVTAGDPVARIVAEIERTNGR